MGQTKIEEQDPRLGEIAEENISECHVHIKQATSSLILIKIVLW